MPALKWIVLRINRPMVRSKRKDAKMREVSGFRSRIIPAIAIFAMMIMVSSCASSRSGQVYSRDNARKAQTVENGTVESVKEVLIEGTKTPAGTIAGGVAGGVVGSTVGSGSGRRIATVLGALAGAAAGTAAEEGLTRRQGLEIVVAKDNGETIVVVQEADVLFAPGDRVRIIRAPDGTTRVSK